MVEEVIRFSRETPWSCPAYKDFYIKDRPDGKDIHGHDTYSYALYRRMPFVTIMRFRTRKQAYRHVSRLTGLDQISVIYGNSRVILNSREYLGVICDDKMYRIAKHTHEVQMRPAEDTQLTGWFDNFNECLETAKQLVRSR